MRQFISLLVCLSAVTASAQTLQDTLGARSVIITRTSTSAGTTGPVSLHIVRARAGDGSETSGVQATIKQSEQVSHTVTVDKTELAGLTAAITKLIGMYGNDGAIPDAAYVTKSGFTVALMSGNGHRYFVVKSAPKEAAVAQAPISVSQVRQLRDLIVAATAEVTK